MGTSFSTSKDQKQFMRSPDLTAPDSHVRAPSARTSRVVQHPILHRSVLVYVFMYQRLTSAAMVWCAYFV